jgi:antitoxin component YwqK of YwqJK toxin-antitoxin module
MANSYFENIDLLQNTLLPYFSEEEPLKSINKKFYKLNYEKYLTHLQPHGLTEFYLDKFRFYVRKNYKNGKLDGLQELYQNGKIYEREFYKYGKLNGLSEKWYKDGNLHSISNYKNGKKDGLYEQWWENDMLSTRCNYKNDKLNGLYEEWHKCGVLSMKIIYNKGKRDDNCCIIS